MFKKFDKKAGFKPPFKKPQPKPKTTSWGGVATWYDGKIKEETSFQNSLILPNLERLIEFKKTDKMLDLACGSGFFSHHFAPKVEEVIGVDIGPELIKIAKEKAPQNCHFFVENAEKIEFLENNYFDKCLIILAIQNIENINKVFALLSEKMKKGGKIYLVLNHPCFRVPKNSEWIWQEEKKQQNRLISAYMSEQKNKIEMNPGQKNGEMTVSFHHSLQTYFKQFNKNGFAVTRLEEWISNKKSDNGPRDEAMEKVRHEFPLFMFLELEK